MTAPVESAPRSGPPAEPAALAAGDPPGRRAFFTVALATLTLFQSAGLWRLIRAHPSLPLWDEAAHGVAGVHVADALRHLNPIELLAALNRQVVWPFVHSLLLAPALLIDGNSVAAAEATSLLLYAALAMALFWAGSRLHPRRGALVGLAAAVLALLSPEFQLFGTLAMLEMPGAVLLVTAFALHLRAADEPFSPRRLRVAGLATTALFLCKYNYGLLWLVPLAAWEWPLLPAEFRARARAAIRRRMTWRWWGRPVPLTLAAGALVVAAILATGGGVFTVLGQRVSMRSPGNLAYALWLLALGWLVVPRRGGDSRAAWIWSRLPERARVLVQFIVLPLAAWFTLPWPNRVREFFAFVANRDSGASPLSLETWAFYPRALALDYSPAPWVGAWVLVLALAGTLWGLRRGAAPAIRLAALALAVSLAATMLHRYRDARFLFTVCPLLWLMAAWTAASLLDGALRRMRAGLLGELVMSAAGAFLIASAWIEGPSGADLLARRTALRGPQSTVAAADAVLDAVAPRLSAPDFSVAAFTPMPLPAPDPNRDFPARAVLLGYGNIMSPGLIDWRARVARPDIPRTFLPKRAPFVAAGAEEAALDARARWLEGRADLVIVALADSIAGPLGGEYRNEVWADRETAARLAESPNWTRLTLWRQREWRVQVYGRAR